MEDIIQIHVKIQAKSTNEPLTGEEYYVKFYDKDVLKDDFLGESDLDGEGHAIVSIQKSDFRSADSFLEDYPDLYFTLHKNGEVIYKSPVFRNLHIEEAEDFPASGGLHYNLGTFVI